MPGDSPDIWLQLLANPSCHRPDTASTWTSNRQPPCVELLAVVGLLWRESMLEFEREEIGKL